MWHHRLRFKIFDDDGKLFLTIKRLQLFWKIKKGFPLSPSKIINVNKKKEKKNPIKPYIKSQ